MSDTIFPIQSLGHASPLRTLAGTMDAMGTSYALVRDWWQPLPFAARTRFVFARPAQGPRLFGRRGWRNRKAVLEEVTIQETRRASRAKAVALRLLDASSAATSLSVATTRLGRRRRSPITHGSALVAFERSRLALALLISSRRKYRLPAQSIFAAG